MYPNTFMMQELIRRYFDEALDREDEGKEVEKSYVYTIPKGTVSSFANITTWS
jgi:hypothetical protein